MQTTIKQFQEEISDILNKDPWFKDHGVVWLPEDALDISFQIKESIGKTGLAAVVTTPNLDYQGEHSEAESKKNYEKTVDGDTTIWTVQDEQGREVTLSHNGSEWAITGGCFASNTNTFFDEDIVDGVAEGKHTEDGADWSWRVTFDEDKTPQSISLQSREGATIGKPFDKLLKWIEVNENAWFTTDYIPNVNNRIAVKLTTIGQPDKQAIAFATSTNASDQFSVYINQANPTFYIRRGTNTTATMNAVGVYDPPYTSTSVGPWVRNTSIITQQLANASQSLTGNRTFVNSIFTCCDDYNPLGDESMMMYNRSSTTNTNPNYVANSTLTVLGQTVANANMQAWYGRFHWLTLGEPKATTLDFAAFPVLKDGKVCLWDSVSDKVYQNGCAGDTSSITWEEDAEYNKVTEDKSEAEFTETVLLVNKGFDTDISLQLIENPTVNRGKPDKDAIVTALDAAHHAVYTLAGYDSGNFNNFNFSTIRQSTVGSAGNKLLQVEARFKSTVVL